MAEIYWTCSFWPRCAIHKGRPLPRHFSEDNLTEIKQMRRGGARLDDIARDFDTTRTSISNILRSRKEEVA